MTVKYQLGRRYLGNDHDIPDVTLIGIQPRCLGGECCGDTKELSPMFLCQTGFGDEVFLTREELHQLYEPTNVM